MSGRGVGRAKLLEDTCMLKQKARKQCLSRKQTLQPADRLWVTLSINQITKPVIYAMDSFIFFLNNCLIEMERYFSDLLLLFVCIISPFE